MLKTTTLASLLLLATACGSVVETSSVSSSSAAALGESTFLDETNFEADFQSRVLPLIQSAKSGFFDGAKGGKIFHQAFENPNAKGKIVIVTGFSENTLKYRETIFNFYQAGYSVYIYDHRGQGASTRYVTDREMVHVDAWGDYLADLRIFLSKVVPANSLPTMIFSHSMGAAIVADALTETPTMVKAAALGSPALALKQAAGSDGELLIPAQALAQLNVTFGRGKQYGLYQTAIDHSTWTIDNANTSSPERFTRYKTDLIAANLAMGGASWGWQNETLKMNVRYSIDFTNARNLRRASFVSKVTTPILMGQAGQDTLAFAGAQDDYCMHAKACNVGLALNKNGKKPLLFEASRHELYNEKSEIRSKWIEESLKFFEANLK